VKKLIIIGWGELGSRFLQAAAQIQLVGAIDIVEPSEQAREIAMQRLKQVLEPESLLKVQWLIDISEVKSNYDLCVIATQANGREYIFEQLAQLGIKNVLTEKIVCQSERAYLKMLHIAETNKINVWVNCKTRSYPIWQYVKGKLNQGERVLYHSIGGNHGLCTNGIHSLDLFVFLSDSEKLVDAGSQIDAQVYVTKRNKYDISGSLNCKGVNNSICVIDYSESSQSSILEIVTTDKYRWVIDHATRQAYEGSINNKWVMEPILFEGDLSVSAMSKGFISDILAYNNCSLPNIRQTYTAHQYLFQVSLPIFNNFLKKDDDICPCT
jgi:predicted dehydrogenase